MVKEKLQSKSRGRGRPSRNQEDVGRQALLDATVNLLCRTDPTMVTRQMIAAEAGVDPNLIRYYFGNIAHLMLEVAIRANRMVRKEMSESRLGMDMEDRLRLKIDRTFRLFSDNPFIHRLVTTVIDDESNAEAQAEWHATLLEAVEDVADALKRDKQLTSVDTEEAEFLHLLIISACEFWTNNQKIIDNLFDKEKNASKLEKRYVEFVTKTILHGVTGGSKSK